MCGVTFLDYDHVDILGSRIEQIAEQKAGIVKPGVPVFVGRQKHAAAVPVLADKASRTGVRDTRLASPSFLRMVTTLVDLFYSSSSVYEGGR